MDLHSLIQFRGSGLPVPENTYRFVGFLITVLFETICSLEKVGLLGNK